MKIKSIDNFTWEECNEYLNSNPNGEYVQKVLERMNFLSQLREGESHNAHEDFLKQFNRLYVTKRYHDAFLLCLNSINTPSISSSAYDNAKRVIPFLSQNGIIPVLNCINMDIIIDVLIEKFNNVKQKEFKKLFAQVQAAENQEVVIEKFVRHYFEEIIRSRPCFPEPKPEEFVEFFKNLGSDNSEV